MARRTRKIPKQDLSEKPVSKEEELDKVLTRLNSIHSKHHETSPRGGPSFLNKKVIMTSSFIIIISLGVLTLGTQFMETETISSIDSLDFTIQLLDKSEVLLSDYKGEPIILDFMARYCSACKTQIDEFKLFQPKYPEVRIISVSVSSDDSITLLKNYKNNYGISWTLGRDITKQGAKLFSVQYIPKIALFDSKGTLKHENTGVVNYDTLVEWVNEL
ncbi:MAG: TlpA family protein disulfide reductase [Promethearchaeota archaeon]